MLNRFTLAGLCGFWFVASFETIAQEAQSPVGIDFKPTCVQALISAKEVRPGGEIAVTLRFRNEGTSAAPVDYVVFTHVEFPEKSCSDIVVQAYHRPTVPTTCWEPGKVISDGALLLRLPASARDGIYHLHLGVYDPANPSAACLSDQYVAEIIVSRDAPEIPAMPPQMAESEVAARRAFLAGRVRNASVLQDERIAFRVSRSSGAWELTDRAAGETWHSSPERECFGTIQLSNGLQTLTRFIDSFSSIHGQGNRLLLTHRPKTSGGSLKVVFTIELLPQRGLRFQYSETSRFASGYPDNHWQVESVRLLDASLWVTDTDGGS